ncbi:MAG: hypothetical protein Q8Q41_02370 [bacterium]|nr:hypothetical protein [bacterium]
MMTLQVLAVLLCTLLLWTLIRDRKMTLKARVIEGFILFGLITGGIGSVLIGWEMITLFSLTGYGAVLFAGGLAVTLLALEIQDPLVLCSFVYDPR